LTLERRFRRSSAASQGPRLYWIAEHWHEVRGDLIRAISGGAGFTWYGGLLGGVAAALVVARMRRLQVGTVANEMSPAVALGYAVARIGCFLGGDGTYGRASELPWAMAFPRGVVPTTVSVQPTALYEVLAMLAIFFVLYRLARMPQPGWHVFAWFRLLSGVERFAVEFVRTNSTWLFGLTPPQWLALFGIRIGPAVLIVTRVHTTALKAA
jgi:phosphatidylglycerol:prolipoprotein diacylglycerol transferase